MTESKRPNQGKAAKDLNATIRYTMWSVFKLRDVLGESDRASEAAEVEKLFAELGDADVTVRGLYDVAGLRADADLMVWWHASTADELQDAYHRFRRTAFGARLEPVWSQMALHRPAEFNKSHVPAFLADEQARAYVCVYPFVRSYESNRRRFAVSAPRCLFDRSAIRRTSAGRPLGSLRIRGNRFGRRMVASLRSIAPSFRVCSPATGTPMLAACGCFPTALIRRGTRFDIRQAAIKTWVGPAGAGA